MAELAEEHVQGRIDAQELSRRSALAYRARTRAELARVLSDLPGGRPGPPQLWAMLERLRPRDPFPGLAYADFWPRGGALATDLLVLAAAGYGLHALTGSVLLPLPLAGVYFVALWAAGGRTLGMLLVGIRVVRQEDGGRLGLRRSLVRLVGYLVDGASCMLGFAWAAVDRRRQGWHDKMAGSYVVRRRR